MPGFDASRTANKYLLLLFDVLATTPSPYMAYQGEICTSRATSTLAAHTTYPKV